MQSITKPELNAADTASRELKNRPFYAGFLFFAAILLPLISFAVEISSGWCAESFFDPMPTWWHVLLVLFVPVTNLQTWLAVRNKQTKRLSWLGFASALTIFISLFYTIVYAPLFPLAVFALLLLGLGILPMTPMFALLGTILLRRELKKITAGTEPKPFGLRWAGTGAALAAVVVLVTVAELPFTITRIAMREAASEDSQKQLAGLQTLRRWGSDHYLLRSCYQGSGLVTLDLVSNLLAGDSLNVLAKISSDGQDRSVTPEKAREIYYRLHGKPYNAAPAPRGVKSWEREMITDFSDDPAAMNNRVNQGLTMSASTLDGSVDGDAALSYLEWTLTIRNEQSWQQEAVADIQLPPGAVVSRLTLWINGEEREAAFAGRERVTQAYNSVARTRRDPVLVTTAGRDRIALRASPVLPHGEMKFRIGITAPLYLENERSSLLLLPHFNERNFAAAAEHSIWIESKKPLESANPAFTIENNQNLSAVRGKIRDADLARTGAPVRAFKAPAVKFAWAKLAPDSTEIVRQEISAQTAAKPASLIFVVDAGAKMQPLQNELAAIIKTLPAEVPAALILIGGSGLNVNTAAPNSLTGTPAEIAAQIENADFAGGTDSIAALEKAWDLTETMPNSAVLWIHATQPLKLSASDSLIQRLRRRPLSQPIYSLQTTNGANAVEKEIDGFGKIRTVPRFGKVGDDLRKFLSDLKPNAAADAVQTRYAAYRTIDKLANAANLPDAKETSTHLTRLWANEEVARLLENNEDAAALDLSVKNQLVTPVSGAVVLETQAQYEQNGLRPVAPNTVPTIPEPEEYLLFAVVLTILGWLAWRRRGGKQSLHQR